MYENEGIKCYALAPWFADTNLVRSSLKQSSENPGLWTRSGQSMTTVEVLEKSTKMRVLNVHEVGAALMKSLQYDKNGALYVIMPDAPLIEYPINETLEFYGVVMAALKIGAPLNIELFTYKHFMVICLGLVILGYHLLLYML